MTEVRSYLKSKRWVIVLLLWLASGATYVTLVWAITAPATALAFPPILGAVVVLSWIWTQIFREVTQ